MKKTPLRRVSKKQQARLRIYYKLKDDYLSQNPVCEICNKRGSGSTDVHHKEKRGPKLNDVSTWAALCRQCHSYVEDNKSWAREEGWLK
jgi:hypothetical protein